MHMTTTWFDFGGALTELFAYITIEKMASVKMISQLPTVVTTSVPRSVVASGMRSRVPAARVRHCGRIGWKVYAWLKCVTFEQC